MTVGTTNFLRCLLFSKHVISISINLQRFAIFIPTQQLFILLSLPFFLSLFSFLRFISFHFTHAEKESSLFFLCIRDDEMERNESEVFLSHFHFIISFLHFSKEKYGIPCFFLGREKNSSIFSKLQQRVKVKAPSIYSKQYHFIK